MEILYTARDVFENSMKEEDIGFGGTGNCFLSGVHYDISALTNCGGFDETFLPTELNPFGLVGDFEKAYDI